MDPLRLLSKSLLVLALFIPVQVCAAIYVYEDENGVRHYTNTPTSKRYKLVTLPRLSNQRSDGYSGGYHTNRRYTKKLSIANDPLHYDRHIERASLEHMLDPMLIKAVIKVESNYNQFATSSKGAQGLMQLMPGTARDLRVGNPYNARQNINGGTRYLKKLLDIYDGDLSRSLAAYNAGPRRVAKTGPLPRIKETRDYVQKVIKYYHLYQQARSSKMPAQVKLNNLVTVN